MTSRSNVASVIAGMQRPANATAVASLSVPNSHTEIGSCAITIAAANSTAIAIDGPIALDSTTRRSST